MLNAAVVGLGYREGTLAGGVERSQTIAFVISSPPAKSDRAFAESGGLRLA